MKFKVVEKNNHLAVHCITYSRARGEHWIETTGNSKIFMDKTLTAESFEVIEAE
ncbi:MAG: hypothetical protein MJK15_00755 [Colwellia sp.]|nr:hypothetical protein [Colwellia sp.]